MAASGANGNRTKGTGEEPTTPVERLVLRTPATFRRRMLAGAALAILALAAVSAFLAWHQYRTNQHRAIDDLNARVVLVGTILDTAVQGGIDTLEATATSPVVTRGRPAAIQPYLARVHKNAGRLFTAGMAWLDTSGNVRATSTTSVPALNLAYRDYFKRVLATKKPYVSSGLLSRGSGRPTVVVAVPTFDRSGKLAGVLNGAIALDMSQTPPAL